MSLHSFLYFVAYGVLALCGVLLFFGRLGNEKSAVMEVSFRVTGSDSTAVFELDRCTVMEEAAFIMVYGGFTSRRDEVIEHVYVSARFFDSDGRELVHRRSPIVDGFVPPEKGMAFAVGIPARQDVARAEVELQDLDGSRIPTAWNPNRRRGKP